MGQGMNHKHTIRRDTLTPYWRRIVIVLLVAAGISFAVGIYLHLTLP